jgi:hypothetical protein
MASALGGEGFSFEQNDVGEAFFREVVGDAGAHHTAANDYGVCGRSQFMFSLCFWTMRGA